MHCVAHQAPSVHGILQARILEWTAIPFPGDLPDPRIELACPTSNRHWQAGLYHKQLLRVAMHDLESLVQKGSNGRVLRV